MNERLIAELKKLGADDATINAFVDGLDESQLQRTVGKLVRDFYLIFNVE